MTDVDTRPRYDVQAEQATLGAMMMPNGPFDLIERALRGPQDFYRPLHGIIYRALLDLRDAGKVVDPIELLAAMDVETQRKIGGANYLHDCMAEVPLAANGPWYAAKVRKLAVLRELNEHAVRTMQAVSQVSVEDADRAVELAQKTLADVTIAGASSSLQPWSELIEDAVGEVEQAQDRSAQSDLPGIPTGWLDVDRLLCNLQPGQVITIGGRPGTGKSNAGLNIAQNAAMRHGKRTAVFSLEMTAVECGLRIISAGARVPLHLMRSGNLSDEDWTRIARYLGETGKAPLFIDETPSVGLAHVRAELRGLVNRVGGVDLVVFDYLQLGTAPSCRSRQEEVAALSRGFKLIAKEFGVPAVVLSQLNRGPEQRNDKRPQLSDLRESGSVEQDCDVVILVHRDDYYDKESPRAGEADFIVAKHRQGPTDTITLAAQLHLCRFVDMAIA